MDPRKRLTDESYWNEVHSVETVSGADEPRTSRQWLRHIGRSYAGEHFWNVLHRYLHQGDLTVLEIGSAPGTSLREFSARFGYEPYGVEYSHPGVCINRANFQAWGFDPEHILESDVFARNFQSENRARFDVVMSRGFIEHFTELQSVIDAHLNLLKPDGTLIVSIPNYSGLNYALGMITLRLLYPLHNLDIMRLPVFRRMFERPDIKTLFCGYEGGFDLGLMDGGNENALLLKLTRRVQWALNILFNAISCVPETHWTSPHLLYIGRKAA